MIGDAASWCDELSDFYASWSASDPVTGEVLSAPEVDPIQWEQLSIAE